MLPLKRFSGIAGFLILVIVWTVFSFASCKVKKAEIIEPEIPVKTDTPRTEIPPDTVRIYKILAIGNSFSDDALESHLHGLAKAADVSLIIGNLYIGGASLPTHWNNASNNKDAYSFRKIGLDGKRVVTDNVSIATAIDDEAWDFISLQQVSHMSGKYETYIPYLKDLADYVRDQSSNENMQLVLHQVWAYAEDSDHSGFANYNRDQLTMYNAIVNAVDSAKDLAGITIVVPSGTAIQNGRTSYIGDNFTRDGYHLNMGIGRYTASCTWLETLLGKSAVGNSYRPNNVAPEELKIGQHAAHYAYLNPKKITVLQDYITPPEIKNLTGTISIGFGSNGYVPDWNTAATWTSGYSIKNLIDQTGEKTKVSFSVTKSFNGRNTNGEANVDSVLAIPPEVSQYSFYGNAARIFSDKLIDTSEIKFTGLEKDKTYTICFFASRGSVSDNRETAYILKGKTEHTLYLNASNNRSDTVCQNHFQPDENGEIRVTLTAGKNNNNDYGFFYINAMRISSE